tara:strand:- start:357 stop:719 length:363 start_codon:yes stop_codon:yes gene_type:complete
MISKSYKILAILLLILGIAHCTMVFVYFDSLTAEALFSLGTGIGVFFLGLLNYAAAKVLSPILLTTAVIANSIQTLYGIVSLTVMNDPQAYAGVLIFLTTLLMSFVVWKRNAKAKATKFS